MSTPENSSMMRMVNSKIVFEAILLCFLAKCINSLWPLVHKASSELFQLREQRLAGFCLWSQKREWGQWNGQNHKGLKSRGKKRGFIIKKLKIALIIPYMQACNMCFIYVNSFNIMKEAISRRKGAQRGYITCPRT